MRTHATHDMLTVEDATERIIDYRGRTPPKTDAGVRLITAKVVKDGRILQEPAEYIAADYYDCWMRRGMPQKDDILLTTEAPLGEVAILSSDDRVALAQRIILLRAKKDVVDPHYLYYALRAASGQSELRFRASGTTVLGIKQSELRKVQIPFFPLVLQRQVRRILGAYDELIENNEDRIGTLEEMARALYRESFVFPVEASIVQLGDIAHEVRRNISSGTLSEPTQYVGLEHIPRRRLALNSWSAVTELGSNKLGFKRGEILFGKIRPYFHKVSIAPFDGVCSADTIVINPKHDEHWATVAATVSSDAFVAHATATSNGAKMPRANWAVLKQYEVRLPPVELRRRFDELFRGLVAQMQTLVFQIHNLRTTRDLLLPRLMSGRIQLRDVA